MKKPSIKVGDLVRVSQEIEEYVQVLGTTIGTVINIEKSDAQELFEWQLLDIYWPGGTIESLYLNEIEIM